MNNLVAVSKSYINQIASLQKQDLIVIAENCLKYFSSHRKKTTLVLGVNVIALYFALKLKEWYKMRRYFKKMGIPGPAPAFMVGNFPLLAQGLIKFDTQLKEEYGKIVGVFEGSTPVIITTDLRFIKAIMIKDFSHFTNRRSFDMFEIEPIDKFLTVLKGEEWKSIRSIVTTTFTSGKLKTMIKCIDSCTKNFSEYLENLVEKDGIMDTKWAYTCYTVDVITSCCFGVEMSSIKDPENEVYKQIQKIFSLELSFSPKVLLAFILPKLAGFLAKRGIIEFFPMEPVGYLSDLTNQVIERRKKKLERREDFIQHMVECEDDSKSSGAVDKTAKTKKTLTNTEILAQAIVFLVAGSETTATTLGWITHNLALNPECQDRLIEEVDAVLDKHDGKVSYDSVNEMSYMEQCIDETLRMYPPILRLDRVCTQDYKYENIKIPKGHLWGVSVWAIHHDPEIYPDPYKFDPERFSEDNKKKRENEAFIPFGTGPRNCIGMRFALLEIKLLLATILSKYKFVKCEKTEEKVDIDNSGLCRPVKPIMVQVKSRF